MTSEKLFEQASALIQKNDALCNSEEAWNIVHALQILIEANKLEPEITPLKIKIIIEMASCNYLMQNYIYAYNCAVIAKQKIDEYIEFTFDDSFTRKMLGEEESDKIIEAVKRNISIGASSRLMENHVLSYINTNNIRKAFPPKDDASFTKDELYHLIHSIEHTKNAIVSQAYSHGDYQVAKRIESIFNAYKYPLYYIWQKYKFGRDEEVWVEGENMLPYHVFVAKIKENTDELMSLLCNANPFAPLNNGSVITQLLKKNLGDLQARLQGGRI